MTTIKQKVLSEIAKRKQCSRQEVQQFIWVAQGNKLKNYIKRQGYYGTNIVSWKYKGLVDNDTKNVFKITAKGKEYIKNPNKYNKIARLQTKLTRYDSMKKRYDEIWDEMQDLRNQNYHLKMEIDRLKSSPTIDDALDYFNATNGNYSGDTDLYLNTLIDYINQNR